MCLDKYKFIPHIVYLYILELAVRALARIMCANIHSQNGTAILAQAFVTQVR